MKSWVLVYSPGRRAPKFWWKVVSYPVTEALEKFVGVNPLREEKGFKVCLQLCLQQKTHLRGEERWEGELFAIKWCVIIVYLYGWRGFNRYPLPILRSPVWVWDKLLIFWCCIEIFLKKFENIWKGCRASIWLLRPFAPDTNKHTHVLSNI